MDSSLYDELRRKLRDRQNDAKTRHESITGLIDELTAEVERAIGKRGKEVCVWGVIDDRDIFVEHDYRSNRDGFEFALKIFFHDAKDNVISEPIVPFTVDYRGESLIVSCGEDHITIEKSTRASDIKLFPQLLDEPLQAAIDPVELDPDEQ